MTLKPPTDAELLAYAAGELAQGEAATIAAYLANAAPASAAATVARYQTVAALVRSGDGPAPAATLVSRAKAIFPPPVTAPSLVDQLFSSARRVMAELTFETGGPAPALAGFRGGTPQRQMVFEAEGTVVDLQVEPEAECRWRVLGQVDPGPRESTLVVGLAPVLDDLAAVAVTTDRHGGFHLSAATGHYNIFVRVPDALLVLPNLILG